MLLRSLPGGSDGRRAAQAAECPHSSRNVGRRLVTVIGYAAMFGIARQADEGAAAHVWQLLMVGQVPVVAFFAIKWLPTEPRQALLVLALQVGAALAAMFPVWWFQW